MKVAKVGNSPEQNKLKGMQMVQFDCSRYSNPFVSSISACGRFPLLNLSALNKLAFRSEDLLRRGNSMVHSLPLSVSHVMSDSEHEPSGI